MKEKDCGVFIKGDEMLESITGLPHGLAMGALGLMESATIAAAYSKCFNTPWIVDTSNIDPIELSVVAMVKKYDVKEKFLKEYAKIKPSKISKELGELSDLLICMAYKNADPGEFRRVVKYSIDVIDSEKDTNGCFRWSYIYYDIADLKEKYMSKENKEADCNDPIDSIIETPDLSRFNDLEIEAEYKKRFGCCEDIYLTSSATNTKTRKIFDDCFSKSPKKRYLSINYDAPDIINH